MTDGHMCIHIQFLLFIKDKKDRNRFPVKAIRLIDHWKKVQKALCRVSSIIN